MSIVKKGKVIKKTYSFYSYRSYKPHCYFKTAGFLPVGWVSGLASHTKPGRKPLLSYVLKSLQHDKQRNFQVIYISDRTVTKNPLFNSEEIYNLLKKNINFQLYNIKLNNRHSPLSKDPFAYLKENPSDFHRNKWAFGIFQFPFTKTLKRTINTCLTKAVPIKKLEIEYFPDKKMLDIDSDTIKNSRKISIRIRRKPKDLELSNLPSIHFNPATYHYKIPSTFNFAQDNALIKTEKGTFYSPTLFIVGVKKKALNKQRILSKTANILRGEIKAIIKSGIVLVKSSSTNINFAAVLNTIKNNKKLYSSISLISPHVYFKRGTTTTTEKIENPANHNWHSRFSRKKKIAPVEFNGDLFLFCGGSKFPSVDGISEKRTIHLHHRQNTSTDNDKSVSMISELFTERWNISFSKVHRFTSSSKQQSKNKKQYLVPSFQVLSALDSIATFSGTNTLAYFDNAGIIPEMWPTKSSRLFVQHLLKETGAKKTFLIAPFPQVLASTKIKAYANLYLAASLSKNTEGLRLTDFNNRKHLTYKQLYYLPGKDIYSKKAELYGNGNGLAAAQLVPLFGHIITSMKTPHFYQVAEILKNSAEFRGELGLTPFIHNTGMITGRMFFKVLNDRIVQLHNIMDFRKFKKMAYKHIDTLLYGSFKRGQHAAAGITALPTGIKGGFYKTYQFYDRSFTYSGVPVADAIYNLNNPFRLSNLERKELAITAYRGCVFLLCTRNRHRGWIMNLESIVPGGNKRDRKYIQFDKNDSLVFIYTGHGEIIAADVNNGLMQKFNISYGRNKTATEKALAIDHALSNGYYYVDGRFNNIWIYGCGSSNLVLLKYKRIKNTLYIDFDPKLECNKTKLLTQGIKHGLPLGKVFSPPVVYESGSINFIVNSGSATKYIRYDKNGKSF